MLLQTQASAVLLLFGFAVDGAQQYASQEEGRSGREA